MEENNELLWKSSNICRVFWKNSFAGNHEESDEKQLKIFDINMYKKGIVLNKEFIKIFNDYENSAELLYYEI